MHDRLARSFENMLLFSGMPWPILQSCVRSEIEKMRHRPEKKVHHATVCGARVRRRQVMASSSTGEQITPPPLTR
jgi:hypothetical protein